MLVRERMSPNPITVAPDTSVTDALRLMRERKVRRLPVVDGHGQLAGIVSDSDLLYVSPSPATTLSIWEIPDLLARLKIDRVMTRDVITVDENTPVEEAARIMADHKIGGLPVISNGRLAGIITETDLFKTFLDLLGGRRSGVRVEARIEGVPGTVSKIGGAVFAAGGDIVGLGISEMGDEPNAKWDMTIKVRDVEAGKLVEALRPVVSEILDVRETGPVTANK